MSSMNLDVGVARRTADVFAAGRAFGMEFQNGTGRAASPGWTCKPLEVDPDAREVRCNGRLIELTSREADIVAELYKARGNPLSQAMLWERCWIGKGWSYYPEEFANTVDQAIKRLRKSLKRQCPDIADAYHPLVSNIWAQGFALRNLAGIEPAR